MLNSNTVHRGVLYLPILAVPSIVVPTCMFATMNTVMQAKHRMGKRNPVHLGTTGLNWREVIFPTIAEMLLRVSE